MSGAETTPTPHAFARPQWLVRLNLVAAILFVIPSLLGFVDQRMFFGLLWLAIAGLWLRRYRWARESPFLEVTADALVVHLGPGRSRPLPLSEVAELTATDAAVVLRLNDGSGVRFSASDLAPGEIPRLAEVLGRRLDGAPERSTAAG